MRFLKKYKLFIVLSLVILGLSIFSVYGFNQDKENVDFLKNYGWEVESQSCDKLDIIVPSPFDMVYENYNLLQLDAGLDLSPYMGKSGTRYTYIVTNYPLECKDIVYANVIVIDGKCVGGDIMTIPIDGFIHPLSFAP